MTPPLCAMSLAVVMHCFGMLCCQVEGLELPVLERSGETTLQDTVAPIAESCMLLFARTAMRNDMFDLNI